MTSPEIPPAARTLPVVLRGLLDERTPLRLLVGRYGAPLSGAQGRTYARVVFGAQEVIVPQLAGTAQGAEGQPAYVLADQGRMLVLGTVSN